MVRHFFPVAVMGREVMLVIVVIVGHVSGSNVRWVPLATTQQAATKSSHTTHSVTTRLSKVQSTPTMSAVSPLSDSIQSQSATTESPTSESTASTSTASSTTKAAVLDDGDDNDDDGELQYLLRANLQLEATPQSTWSELIQSQASTKEPPSSQSVTTISASATITTTETSKSSDKSQSIHSVTPNSCRSIQFSPQIDNHFLRNHVITRTQVPQQDVCEIRCYQEPNCVSYNFGPAGSETPWCELNSRTHQQVSTGDFARKESYVYRHILNKCQINPCLNGATCQAGFTSNGYRCFCSEGFHGTHCEIDKLRVSSYGYKQKTKKSLE